jgi:hypothetical protein
VRRACAATAAEHWMMRSTLAGSSAKLYSGEVHGGAPLKLNRGGVSPLPRWSSCPLPSSVELRPLLVPRSSEVVEALPSRAPARSNRRHVVHIRSIAGQRGAPNGRRHSCPVAAVTTADSLGEQRPSPEQTRFCLRALPCPGQRKKTTPASDLCLNINLTR